MNIWALEKWKMVYSELDLHPRSGLRLRFDKEVNDVVKVACKDFCHWLRRRYRFPIRIPIYIKKHIGLRTRDGDVVMGVFFMPFSRQEESYIRVASGYFCEGEDRDSLLFDIFFNIAHELTHYFQWINGSQCNEKGTERQATRCANKIIKEYGEYYFSRDSRTQGTAPCVEEHREN